MHQLIYISTVARDATIDLAQVLDTSRRNNARDAITGLLFFDGKRFLQALEGEAGVVARAFARIRDDARHRAVVILSERDVATREFGSWDMALGGAGQDPGVAERVAAYVRNTSPSIRGTFNSFVDVRRAA